MCCATEWAFHDLYKSMIDYLGDFVFPYVWTAGLRLYKMAMSSDLSQRLQMYDLSNERTTSPDPSLGIIGKKTNFYNAPSGLLTTMVRSPAQGYTDRIVLNNNSL